MREPHHHLVFQNEYVRVYEVEVGPHSATLEHQHEYDNLFVPFGNAHLANRVTGKLETHVDLADLAVNFSREPYSHVIRNEADQPFRNITIELLRPQGELREFYPSLDSALAAVPERGRSVRQATVLETQEMRLRAVSVGAGSAWSCRTTAAITCWSNSTESTMPAPEKRILRSRPAWSSGFQPTTFGISTEQAAAT